MTGIAAYVPSEHCGQKPKSLVPFNTASQNKCVYICGYVRSKLDASVGSWLHAPSLRPLRLLFSTGETTDSERQRRKLLGPNPSGILIVDSSSSFPSLYGLLPHLSTCLISPNRWLDRARRKHAQLKALSAGCRKTEISQDFRILACVVGPCSIGSMTRLNGTESLPPRELICVLTPAE